MEISKLLKRAIDLDVKIHVENGNIKLDLPENFSDEEFFHHIKSKKNELISYLQMAHKSNYKTIKPVEEQDYYRLSYSQRRIWLEQQSKIGLTAYNQPRLFYINEYLDLYKLHCAFEKIIEQNEILRTSFPVVEGQPKQKIADPGKVDFSIEKTEVSSSDQDEIIKKHFKKESEHVFDLEQGKLLRVKLFLLPHNRSVVLINTHHIISDKWSIDSIQKQVINFYTLESSDQNKSELQFKDYTAWESKQISECWESDHLTYWKNKLNSPIDYLNLPYDKVKSEVNTNNGRVAQFQLSKNDSEIIKQFAENHNTSTFILLMAYLKVYLFKITGQRDIALGTIASGRDHVDLEKLLGFYVNTFVIRSQIDEGNDFKSFLQILNKEVYEAISHQYLPFDYLIETLNISRERNRNPIFDILVTYDDIPTKRPVIEKQGEFLEGITTCRFDLLFTFQKYADGDVNVLIEYNTDLFNDQTIINFFRGLVLTVRSVSDSIEKPIKKISITSQLDYEKIETFAEQDRKNTNVRKSIIDQFEDIVAAHNDSLALVSYDKSLTYGELNSNANKLARYLKKNYGINEEDIVAVQMEAEDTFIISLLAILKCGAGYLPLDKNTPSERSNQIIKDSKPVLILVDELQGDEHTVFVNHYLLHELEFSTSNFDIKPQVNHLAYIMYTSGSTGYPKGVMAEHGCVTRLVNETNYISLDKNSRLLKTGSVAFDASIFEIWGMLLNAGILYLLSIDDSLNNHIFKEKCNLEFINTMWLTSSLFNQIVDEEPVTFKSVENLIVGGEKLSPNHINKLKDLYDNINIINGYGPTENTTFSISHLINDKYMYDIPLGSPISYTQCFVVDKDGNDLHLGAVGEICLGGEGLARGYLNNPELTHEKFIRHPQNNQRVYKTGDFGKWNDQGLMEFKGRRDNQVKIRGYRIETGEIEYKIRELRGITDAFVKVHTEKSGYKNLIAFVVSNEEIVNPKSIKNYLSQHLPDYMVPVHIILLDKFPLTKNGKLDIASLPLPQQDYNSGYKESLNPREKIIYTIWKDLLRLDDFSKKQTFFELGGDSIKAIQVSSRMFKEGYQLSTKDVIIHQTIENLAVVITKLSGNYNNKLQEGEVPLTPIQKEFFESKKSEDLFHQSVIIHAEEGFKTNNLKKVFSELVEHHDALRIAYQIENANIRQYNSKEIDIEIKEYDFFDTTKSKIIEVIHEVQSTLDIQKSPLIKLALFHTSQGDYILIVVSHLIFDGVSMRILLEDFETLLNQIRMGSELLLSSKSTSFKQWAEHLIEYSNNDKLLEEKVYWKQIVETKNKLNVTNQTVIKKDRLTKSIEFEPENTKKLNSGIQSVYNAGMDVAILSAFTQAAGEVLELNEVSYLMESYGRQEFESGVDVSRTIGWFTSVYPCVVPRASEIRGQVVNAKEVINRIPNMGMGYGILKYLTDKKLVEDIEFNLLPDIVFNYLGQFDSKLQSSGLNVIMDGLGGNNTTMFTNIPIHVQGVIIDNKLTISVKFENEIIEEEKVIQILVRVKYFLNDLNQSISHNNQKVLTPSDLIYKNLTLAELESIKKNGSIKDVYPLTSMQAGMVFHSLKEPDSKVYFIQKTFRLNGNLNIGLLKESFKILFDRHENLKSKLDYKTASEPLLIISKDQTIDIEYEDLTHLSTTEQKLFLEDRRESDRQNPFELDSGILMRLSVYQIGQDISECLWSFHHTLMDGWSVGVFMNEVSYIYSELANHNIPVFQSHPNFKEYLNWLTVRDTKSAKKHWSNYLNNLSVSSLLPKKTYGKSRKKQFVKNRLEFTFDETKKIKKFAAKNGITLSNFLKSIWGILLSKYAGINDVVFGEVVSGRPSGVKDVESIIGLFINTIPSRIRYNEEDSFIDLINRVRQDSIENESFQHQPLAEISGSVQKNELFDHIFIFENYPSSRNIDGLAKTKKYEDQKLMFKASADLPSFEQTNYDLNIAVYPLDHLAIAFSYNEIVYEHELISDLKKYLAILINKFINEPEVKLSQLKLVDYEDQAEAFACKSSNSADQLNGSILETLWHQVTSNAHMVAVTYLDQQLTYAELDSKSNLLANSLINDYNVKPSSIVGLMIDRSPEMIIGILAILKSGGAYLPIDPAYPIGRRKFMIDDSALEVILTESSYIFDLESYSGQLFEMDVQLHELEGESIQPDVFINEESLAYVIYTSGTMGKSKGVMIQHGSLENFVKDQVSRFDFKRGDHVFQFISLSFDASVLEIFSALASSSRLILPNREVINNLELFHKYINENIVNILTLTPSFLTNLDKKELRYVDTVITGAEDPILKDVRALVENTRYINSYGPSEGTVCTSFFEVGVNSNDLNRVPIGKSISNTRLYLLNKFNKPVLRGAKGEIFIAGKNLARGYLNRPELTAEKFLNKPFGIEERVYQTGDLARWNFEGQLEFLGREDEQVKIKGIRIELNEIEHQLLRHSKITNVAMKVLGNHGEKVIVGYYTSEVELSIQELKQFLEQSLPENMIPHRYMRVDQMPLTVNGKINKNLLPNLEIQHITNENREQRPLTYHEQMLVDIYKTVLGISDLAYNSNFFELGGDSIKAIQISSRLYQNGFKIEIADVFNHQTIEELAPELKKINQEIDQGPASGKFALSPIQVEFFKMKLQNSHYFNLSMIFKCKPLSAEEVRKIFQQLSVQHDVLRVKFEENGMEQVIYPIEDFFVKLDTYDISTSVSYGKELKEIAGSLQSSLNIYEGPLWRIALFILPNNEYRLLFVIHHLIVDVVSWSILTEDMNSLLLQSSQGVPLELPNKTDSYLKWVSCLQDYAKSDELLSEKEYWNKIHSVKNQLEINDNIGSNPDVASSEFSLSPELTNQLLTKVNASYNTEINDVLLTGLGIAFKKQCDMDEVLITMENHGREHNLPVNVSRTVGWFTSIYPILVKIDPSLNLEESIIQVKENIRKVPNKGFGYNILKNLVQGGLNAVEKKDNSPTMSFNFLGQIGNSPKENIGIENDSKSKPSGFAMSNEPIGRASSNENNKLYDLEIMGMVINGQLQMTMQYYADAFGENQMDDLMDNYKSGLTNLIEFCVDKNELVKTPSDFTYKELTVEEMDNLFD